MPSRTGEAGHTKAFDNPVTGGKVKRGTVFGNRWLVWQVVCSDSALAEVRHTYVFAPSIDRTCLYIKYKNKETNKQTNKQKGDTLVTLMKKAKHIGLYWKSYNL